VASIVTDIDGKVTVTIQGFGATTGINGKMVTLVPMKDATTKMQATDVGGATVFGWRCGSQADGTDLNPRYLPGSCRG
jgi:type IV pilus assembly protein PilA